MKTILLLAFFSLYLPVAGVINTACASQKNIEQALPANPQKITGKVTQLITSAGFAYVEVDTGVEKVWVAGPDSTTLKKGDMTAFTTEMRMQNFYSKSLERNFSVIYFTKRLVTENESLAIANQRVKSKATSTTPAVTQGEVRVGEKLREMKLDGLNGTSKKFSDFKGKPLIINVWASWCGPCRAEMASLKNLAQRYNGKQFNLIGVSTDDYRNRAESFIKQTDISFENFMDHKLQLEKMLGATTLPLTVFVDEHGYVLAKVRGAREWDKPEIIDAISEVLRVELNN